MTDPAPRTVTAAFEITGWEEVRLDDEAAGGPKRARVTVAKRFSGALEGTSVAELLSVQSAGGRGYVASEVVDATLEGRHGTFVIQHGGIGGATGERAFGHVVPGSGTGELAGLLGQAAFAHDEAGARVTLIVTG